MLLPFFPPGLIAAAPLSVCGLTGTSLLPPFPAPPAPRTRVHPKAAQTLFANLMQAKISLSDLAWPHFVLHINLLGTRHSQCHSMSGGPFTVKEEGKEGASD